MTMIIHRVRHEDVTTSISVRKKNEGRREISNHFRRLPPLQFTVYLPERHLSNTYCVRDTLLASMGLWYKGKVRDPWPLLSRKGIRIKVTVRMLDCSGNLEEIDSYYGDQTSSTEKTSDLELQGPAQMHP